MYQKLYRFPLGSIRPAGFLADQCLRSKDGMGGHLNELEPEMIDLPYVKNVRVEAWSAGEQCGWGAEISGSYWSGLIQLAFTMHDSELIAKAEKWVNAVLKRQREDGYLGTYDVPGVDMLDDYNAWGTSRGMKALLSFYDATGREDVLEAVHRCLLWFCENWAGDKKTSYAAPIITEVMVLCYDCTGDKRLIDFCEEYEQWLCEHDIFHISYREMLKNKLEYNANHTAGYCLQIRRPAMLYTLTGNKDYLEASRRSIRMMREKAVQLSGGPVSINEYLGPVGDVSESEYCAFAFSNLSYSYMSYITGEAVYGDYMEQVFYNAAQGARKKDERAIAYMSAPNQIYATKDSTYMNSDMQVYAPVYPVSCCPVNSVAILPEFIRGMMLHDGEGNLFVTAYGPCRLESEKLCVTEETMYPFRDTVRLTVHSEGEFAINLKIPTWCKSYTVTVNGKPAECGKVENGYVPVSRVWKPDDSLEIKFAMEIEIVHVDDSDMAKKHPLAILRGPLVYSLHIPERWSRIAGRPYTPLPEGWSWYDCNPAFTDADVPDAHERLGLRRYHTGWNVALDEQLKPEDITVEECDGDGYVWENAPVKLHLRGYRAPFLCAPYPHRTFTPFGDKQTVAEEMQLSLEPYGCTNLRITYFPRADLKK